MANQENIPDETCQSAGCESVTPCDMVSIRFGDDSFCSPDCARAYLNAIKAPPPAIKLHDPQFSVDRAALPPAIGQDDVNIRRPVTGMEDALVAINEIEAMYPGGFRGALDGQNES